MINSLVKSQKFLTCQFTKMLTNSEEQYSNWQISHLASVMLEEEKGPSIENK